MTQITYTAQTSPVPEPVSLVLVSAGLLGAGYRRWHGRASQAV